MESDARHTAPRRLAGRVLTAGALAAGVCASIAVPATAFAANPASTRAVTSAGAVAIAGTRTASLRAVSSSADLSVAISNKTDAKAGKRVSYKIVVTNHGPSAASRVQFDFTTSAALRSIRYAISSGHCVRGTKEVVCHFGTLRKGKTGTATISGIMPKKMKTGTAVTNKVVLASTTHLTNPNNDVATDNYQLGVARPLPVVAASPSPNPHSKIMLIDNAASKAINFSDSALKLSLYALIAAVVWFAVGLTFRYHKRRKAGIRYDID